MFYTFVVRYHHTIIELYEVPNSEEKAFSYKGWNLLHNLPWRERVAVSVQLYSFFILDARWWWVINDTPRSLYTREWPGINFIAGWVGSRAGLERSGKSRPPPGFDSRTVQPLASLYAYCATPTLQDSSYIKNNQIFSHFFFVIVLFTFIHLGMCVPLQRCSNYKLLTRNVTQVCIIQGVPRL